MKLQHIITVSVGSIIIATVSLAAAIASFPKNEPWLLASGLAGLYLAYCMIVVMTSSNK